MKWETQNRINNINQLNQTRQKNKLLKNKPVEEPKEERTEESNPLFNLDTEIGRDFFIEELEKNFNVKLYTYEKKFFKSILKYTYCKGEEVESELNEKY